MTGRLDFRVDRRDLTRTAWEKADRGANGDLAPGELRLAHKCFAFTSNNITYARCGDVFGYWRYFPAAEPWGSIPVWGIGKVIESRHDGIAEGETIYGYFPMSSHLVIQPDRVKATGFVDARPHRAALPRTYNEYIRIDHDPTYDSEIADAHLVLRPLFALSFFLAHFLVETDFFGADNVVISSASAKTAMGLAFQLRRLAPPRIGIIGLTGATNKAFVEMSGLYDHVFCYDDMAAVPNVASSVYVDIAGNAQIRAAAHHHLGAQLRYSCGVGLTHNELPDAAAKSALPGPAPEFFFTPNHILKRREVWGPDELRRRLSLEWRAFVAQAAGWLTIEHSSGPAAIEHVYAQVLHGKRAPDRADILAFDTE
jgi:Protein of unknown function (DUF2855)